MIAPGEVAVAAPAGQWDVVELDEEPEPDGILDVAHLPGGVRRASGSSPGACCEIYEPLCGSESRATGARAVSVRAIGAAGSETRIRFTSGRSPSPRPPNGDRPPPS